MIKVDCISEYGQERYDAGKIDMIEILKKDGSISLECAVNELFSLNCSIKTISKITGLYENKIKIIID